MWNKGRKCVGRVSRVQEMVLVLGKVGKVLLVDVLALFPISLQLPDLTTRHRVA